MSESRSAACGVAGSSRAMDNVRGGTIMIEQPSFIRSVVCRCIVAVWLDWRTACLLRGHEGPGPSVGYVTNLDQTELHLITVASGGRQSTVAISAQ